MPAEYLSGNVPVEAVIRENQKLRTRNAGLLDHIEFVQKRVHEQHCGPYNWRDCHMISCRQTKAILELNPIPSLVSPQAS
jgi:hypothetical protein